MIPPHFPNDERADRLRRLLALEIVRILEDLELRRETLVEVWSKHRLREPFLDTLFSRWTTLGFPLLAEFEPEQVTVLDAFYREVEDFKLYICFTQDMPTTLGERYDEAFLRIRAYGAAALEVLGGAPERPLVDLDDDAEREAGAVLLLPGLEKPARPVTADDAEE